MAQCKDCFHYDVCYFHTTEETDLPVTACTQWVNKADVVPKSEVDKLEKELAGVLVSKETELHIPMEYLVRVRTKHPIYQAIKLEVAREIFEEIERTFKALLMGDITDIEKILAELKKKYMESEDKG